jgi:hypothetical protein
LFIPRQDKYNRECHANTKQDFKNQKEQENEEGFPNKLQSTPHFPLFERATTTHAQQTTG